MSDDWANSGGERTSPSGLDLHLDPRGPGLRAGLMNALREAVRDGRLAAGARLPSSRSLAADLGVARNTVADSYAELIAEGWLVAERGSGTRVANRAQPRRNASVPSRPQPPSRGSTYALSPGSPNLADFPRTTWLSAARRALTAAPHDALGYGDPLGRMELRTALADYLARVRGVYAVPERVVICAGFHHGLTIMAQALKVRRARAVAVEAYGFENYRQVLSGAGLRTPSVDVDEHGARTGDLARLAGIAAVLVTPAHQYPTGAALHPDRRAAAIDWARDTGSLILEDDYDGEFRYDREPVGALQSLDPERVVYLGSASKSLAPGLRLAWMVVPGHLISTVVAAKGHVDWSSALEQLTLADFIASGGYDRHVRSMRLRYRRRRDQMVAVLAQRAPHVRVSGIAAGLQAVLELPRGTEGAVVRAAASYDLAVSGLADFRHPSANGDREPPERDGLVIGYAAPSDSAWAGALDTLCKVLLTSDDRRLE